MSKTLLHLETLIGKKVHDPSGKCAGRIEEVRAHRSEDGRCIIDDFLLGRGALLTRLSVVNVAGFATGLLGSHGHRHPTHRVPWHQLDLSDRHHPRVTVPVDQLEEFPNTPDPSL
jgi:hypothetical protein